MKDPGVFLKMPERLSYFKKKKENVDYKFVLPGFYHLMIPI